MTEIYLNTLVHKPTSLHSVHYIHWTPKESLLYIFLHIHFVDFTCLHSIFHTSTSIIAKARLIEPMCIVSFALAHYQSSSQC